ncbi:hypothetical protein ACMFMG_010502 [Clarireedia jacksonii]
MAQITGVESEHFTCEMQEPHLTHQIVQILVSFLADHLLSPIPSQRRLVTIHTKIFQLAHDKLLSKPPRQQTRILSESLTPPPIEEQHVFFSYSSLPPSQEIT